MLRLTCSGYISRNVQQIILNTRLLASTSSLLNSNDNREKRGMKLLVKRVDITDVCKESSSTESSSEVFKNLETLVDTQDSELSESVKNKSDVSAAKPGEKNWKSKRKKKSPESNDIADVIKHVENIDLTADGSVEKLKLLMDKINTNEVDSKAITNKEHNLRKNNRKGRPILDTNVSLENKKKTPVINKRVHRNQKSDFLQNFINKNTSEDEIRESDGLKATQSVKRMKGERRKSVSKKVPSIDQNIGNEQNVSDKQAVILELSDNTNTSEPDIIDSDGLNATQSVKKVKREVSSIAQNIENEENVSGKLAEILKLSELNNSPKHKRPYKRTYKQPVIDLGVGPTTELFLGDNLEMKDSSPIGLSSLNEEQWFHKLEKLKTQASTKDINPNAFEVLQMNIERQWIFPIDNEQDIGMEDKISFQDHVFLDNYLNEFPDIDSVQKYMELVIVGLQQNPYLSVEEKRTRILWHKEYFATIPDDDIVTLSS